MYEAKPLPFKKSLIGISDKTIQIHHDKLYVGYVTKKNEIEEKLKKVDVTTANQSYSDLRALKDGETFAVNGVYLHEHYFNVLGGDGKASGALMKQLEKDFGSYGAWEAMFKACGMAARGWAVTAWDTMDGKIKIFIGDAHNQGGVWGAMPLIVLDVYEHAYFIDYGSDRKAYIEDYMKNLNWKAANAMYSALKAVK